MTGNAKYIFYECTKAGMTPEATCALLGNLQEESGFNPMNLEDTANKKTGMTDSEYTDAVNGGSYAGFVRDGFGYGIAQWTFYSRKQNLINFIRARKGSVGDLSLQVAFLLWELKGYYGRIWKMLCSSTDILECTRVLLYEWENPKEKEKNLKQRYANARQWYAQLTKGGDAGLTQEEAIKQVLDLARSEIGYHEKSSNNILDSKTANSGSGNYTKFAEYLDSYAGFYNGPKNGYAWCDVFVDYLFVKSFGLETGRQMICQPLNSAGAGCLYSVQYYKEYNQFVKDPKPGDQIFFTYSTGEVSHTGIVEAVTGNTVTTIEGNSSDQVARRAYTISNSSIYGYGRPRWNLASGVAGSVKEDPPTVAQELAQHVTYGMLIKGSKGEAVRIMQEKLIKLGYDLGKHGADGDFGNDTLNAVKKFQKDYKLSVDGEAGPQTLQKLDELAGVQTEENFVPNAEKKKPQSGTNEGKESKVTVISSASTTQKAKNNGADKSTRKESFSVGDVVNFTGNKHYWFANAKRGSACKPGKARITAIQPNDRVKHPYHLIRVAGGGSTVYGWVDEGDFEAM